MVTFTNQSLQSINKKDMIPIVFSLQNKLEQTKNKVLREIRKLHDNFSKLELSVTKSKSIIFYYMDLQIVSCKTRNH